MRSSAKTLDLLEKFESPNVTYIEADRSWPIVWERARGTRVWDTDGKQYLDLTAAFGVAAAGHANPRVVAAGCRQLQKLPHAMGDVHPHSAKALLARELSRVSFERWTRNRIRAKTIFCNSGFEAVEAALKTARLATGRPGIIAFEGAYHGLGYGALNATHRPHFRGPFQNQLKEFGHFAPYPESPGQLREALARVREIFARRSIGAVLLEPMQARGGIRMPPPKFLPSLARECARAGALLVLDEIYTGFGRTGKWFACEHTGTVPHLVCVGKALSGGFPISACVGQAAIMDRAWPRSQGEAIHTSTFLGNPVGCAMALAQIAELRRRRLPERSAANGRYLLNQLSGALAGTGCLIRGAGLFVGVEFTVPAAGETVVRLMKRLLQDGYIILPEGATGNVLGFTPPLTISRTEIDRAVRALKKAVAAE